MSSLFDRLRESAYERARHFVQRRNAARLLEQLGISGPWIDSYELLQLLASVRALLPAIPPVLIDVGAHRGAFARAADQVLGFERIVCVEPDVELLGELKANVPCGKTSIHPVALAETAGETSLFVHADRTMNSLLPANTEVLRRKFTTYPHDTISRRSVRTQTLDGLLFEEELLDGTPLFLKLDTQGNELNILRAAECTLRCTQACLVEYMFCTPYQRDYSFFDLVDVMEAAGFECQGALNLMRRPSHEVSAVDFLFNNRSAIT